MKGVYTLAQSRQERHNAENYEDIRLRVPKGKKAVIQSHADAEDMSVNAYINEAIDEKMKHGPDLSISSK